MENILRFIGRFLGEKIALLDTIYAKKGEVGVSKGGEVYAVDGYVDCLPPRPVKGDKYIIRPGVDDLYMGIYYLNFGFNSRDKSVFKIIGDSQAQAKGTRRTALLTNGDVRTGRITIRQGAKLKLQVGIGRVAATNHIQVSVEEYNHSGGLVKTGSLSVYSYGAMNYIPDPSTVEVVVLLKGNGVVYYVKLWEMLTDQPDYSSLYCWDGVKWDKLGVPQGVVVGVKGKNFGLVSVLEGFRKVGVFFLPKVEIKGGQWAAGNFISLCKPADQDYTLRLYVKRRRSVKIKRFNRKSNRVKYSECLKAREYHPNFTVKRIQVSGVVFSRLQVLKGKWELPYTWKNLVELVFTQGKNIINRGPLITPSKFYPSTGYHCRDKHRARNRADYADFAMCYAKRIGGEWVEGERCYFRVMPKRASELESVSVRVLD